MSRRFVVAAVVIRDDSGRILLVRKKGTSRFMLPGGKIESGETALQCAVREAHEELGAVLDPDAMVELGQWETAAANEPDHLVHGTIFTHPYVDGIRVSGEIGELLWLDPRDADARTDLAPLFQHYVLPAL